MRAITLDNGSVLAVDDNDGIAVVVPVVGPALVQDDPDHRPTLVRNPNPKPRKRPMMPYR